MNLAWKKHEKTCEGVVLFFVDVLLFLQNFVDSFLQRTIGVSLIQTLSKVRISAKAVTMLSD